jgi:membrane fusion protein, multidrug efflux system
LRSSVLNSTIRTGLTALCISIAIVGCSPGGEKVDPLAVKKERPPLVIPVEAESPNRGDISSYFETSTRVEAERRVDVSSKGSGRCMTIHAAEGDEVKAGDILAELERAEIQATYDQNSIQVRQNKTAYDLAKLQYDEGLGTKIDMDNARYAHEQSLATLESQKLSLENLTIRAPIDGIITTRNIQQGMLISAGDMVYNIMDPSSFILTINPPEKELSRLKLGQDAEVSVDAIPGKVFKASIRRINPSVDPVTGTIKVVLDFEEVGRATLRESAFARVKLVMSTRKNVILIRKEAIVEENGKKFIFLLEETDGETVSLSKESKGKDDKTPKVLAPEVEAAETSDVADVEPVDKSNEVPVYFAKRVEIQTALENNTHIQVAVGVTDSDRLITNGQHSLKDGARVRVTNITDEISRLGGTDPDALLEAAKKKRRDEEGEGESGKGGGLKGQFRE